MSYTSYAEVAMTQNVLSFAIMLSVIFLIAMGISAALRVRKSRQYRKEIVDMYVSAKTKKIAKEESLDLEEEFEAFKKWLKGQRINCNYDLDDVIEDELKEKVSEPVKKPKK